MTNLALRNAKTARSRPALPPLGPKERANFFSAKIPCNALKRLVSDERIQGNPSFSNPRKLGFSQPKGQPPRNPKRPDRPLSGGAGPSEASPPGSPRTDLRPYNGTIV